MPTKLPRTHYLERGVCPGCKCRPLMDGHKQCEVCYQAQTKWMIANRARKNAYNKERYESLKSQGLCVTCKLPSDGTVYCARCIDNLVRYRNVNRPRQSRNKWSKR